MIQQGFGEVIICDSFSELIGKKISLGTVVLEATSGQFDIVSGGGNPYWVINQPSKRTAQVPSGEAIASIPNEYKVSFEAPFTFKAHTKWDKMTIIFDTTNTGPATLKVDSLSTRALKKTGALALEADDIIAGKIYFVIDDGTNYQII